MDFLQVNRMARVSPASGGDVRTRAGWEGDRALDLRIVPNSIAATPLSYALYVVRDDLLCILLDPTRPVAGAIAALDPTWEPTVVGAGPGTGKWFVGKTDAPTASALCCSCIAQL